MTGSSPRGAVLRGFWGTQEAGPMVIYAGLWVAFLVLLPVGVSMNRGKRK